MAQYTIVKKQQVTTPSLVGGFEKAWRISFQIPDGTVGSVTVPDDANWAKAADAAICAQIAQIDELHQLGQ